MKPALRSIYIVLGLLFSTACWNPSEVTEERVQLGPDIPYSLVVYFKRGTTAQQAQAFDDNVLSEQREDGRGARFKDGVGSYLALTPDQGHGHWGFAITFFKKATEEQRTRVKATIRSHELVYKVFENIAPNDIKATDLKSAEALTSLTKKPSSASSPNYTGCWTGMHGGRLKITSDKIYDLGSGERASYVVKPTVEREGDRQGMQTGEQYLLEADKPFSKSFLARIIRISFNPDQTVGFTTYDSYDDYLVDKFVGMGLFEKIPCNLLTK